MKLADFGKIFNATKIKHNTTLLTLLSLQCVLKPTLLNRFVIEINSRVHSNSNKSRLWGTINFFLVTWLCHFDGISWIIISSFLYRISIYDLFGRWNLLEITQMSSLLLFSFYKPLDAAGKQGYLFYQIVSHDSSFAPSSICT